MTGLTRQQAAEAVAALFGTTASHSRSSRTYDPWEVTDNEGKTWRFVFDASICATHRSGRRQLSTGDDTYKVEMNSPKLEYSEMGKLPSFSKEADSRNRPGRWRTVSTDPATTEKPCLSSASMWKPSCR